MTKPQKDTHFGFKSVPWDEKEKKVKEVFQSVAKNYDLMNDLMSLGAHRLWKRYAVDKAAVRPGNTVLDLAGGSGDIAKLLCQKVGSTGLVVLADINDAMLRTGRDKLLNAGIVRNVLYAEANAECLPFANNAFHAITMGFGLRNVTDKESALQSMYRVCKPGGKVLILEFSAPTLPGLQPIYDWYSFNILPKLGQYFANDAESYQYLAESIRMHPNQEALKSLITAAGFEDCEYTNLCGGIVALHTAYKY